MSDICKVCNGTGIVIRVDNYGVPDPVPSRCPACVTSTTASNTSAPTSDPEEAAEVESALRLLRELEIESCDQRTGHSQKWAVIEAKLARLRAEVAELAAWKAEIGGAIERSGMGIMRTSEGPSGTMICYRPEVEEEHNRRTLEVIHENIDLKRERDEARREIKNGAEALEARKKLVPQCHHLPELVIGTEDGYICCECWALQAEKERDDLRAEVQALREENNDLRIGQTEVLSYLKSLHEWFLAKAPEHYKGCGLWIDVDITLKAYADDAAIRAAMRKEGE